MKLPLTGTKIIDLGMYVAGPYTSVPLADFGADVIKIEPISGDPNRGIWRSFACTNRGKRSIAMDLKTPEGLAIAKKICLQADVIHHNFRPGVAERLGLGYKDLKEQKPGLIYLETSAYGDTGPMSKLPGFDMMMQAMCGHESACAGNGNAPLWLRWAPMDFTGGYLGTIGILAALYRKLKTGEGGVIKTNLLNGGLFIQSELIRDSDGQFKGIDALNNSQTGTSPAQSLYRTATGWIAVVACSKEQKAALAELAGVEPTSLEDSFETIAGYFAALDADTALQQLAAKNIWCELCREDVENAVFNTQPWADTGIARSYPHGPNGNVRQLGNMVRLSDVSGTPETSGRTPALGEDTREILIGLGFSNDDIDGLYQRKIVA